MLCAVLFLVSYFTFDIGASDEHDSIGGLGASNVALGVDARPGAAAHRHRHHPVGPQAHGRPRDRRDAPPGRLLRRGPRRDARGAERRRSRSPASAAVRWCATRCSAPSASSPLPAVVMLRDLGPLPGDKLDAHRLEAGMRVVRDVVGTPIKVSDLEIGDLVNAEPEALFATDARRRAGASRASSCRSPSRRPRWSCCAWTPTDIIPGQGRENWSVDGIVCYSKICTHVGCPISLNERTTHHLLCPCHQSTFDLADSGKVIFGPAGRHLPQLPLAVDDEGYLVAQSDFTEPVGPSFWERDPRTSANWVRASDEHRHQQGRHQQRQHGRHRRQAQQGRRGAATWADERLGLATAGEEEPAQGLPRPLVVHARRDRAVELRRPAAHRRLPDAVVHARAWARSTYQGSYSPLRGIEMSEAYASTPEALLRRPWRSAHAADAPLGRDALHRRDDDPPAAGLLHRRVPQAA